MTEQDNCTKCASHARDIVISGGCYQLCCAACGELVVVTSFIAFLDAQAVVSAYIYNGPTQSNPTKSQLLHGKLSDIHAEISKKVAEFGAITLIFEP